jgi:hypothetical protein
MNRILRILGIGLATLALAGCSKHDVINAPAVSGGSADFSVVAAIGTSVSAGYESGGLVVHHQQKAFPYAFAKQVGAAFAIPSVTADGLPPLLQIVSLVGPVINNVGRTPGAPDNTTWPAPYNNMAVPGAVLNDVTNDSRYGNLSTAFPFIARPPLQLGSILDQVAMLAPTFVTFEMGANEVLGPASQGSGAPIIDAATFGLLLGATLDSLEALMPNAKVAIFTVPDITSLPYFTTISPRLDPSGTCRVLGPGPAPLTDNDLVLLTAGPLLATGHGIPGPCGGLGDALPATMVLPAASVASIQTAVDGYNAAIRGAATARGYALVDLNGLLRQAAGAGFTFQGQTYTSAFVTGGLISLDGIHPTDLAHGIICNALIDAVSAAFGSRVPPLNLADYATGSSSRLRPAGDALGIPVIENADAVYGALFGWRGIFTPAP